MKYSMPDCSCTLVFSRLERELGPDLLVRALHSFEHPLLKACLMSLVAVLLLHVVAHSRHNAAGCPLCHVTAVSSMQSARLSLHFFPDASLAAARRPCFAAGHPIERGS